MIGFLENHFYSYFYNLSMILEEFKDRFYILFYDNDTIFEGNFNYLCLEDNNLFNNEIFSNIIKNQNNFESKLVFHKIKSFYQNKNFSDLLKLIKKKLEGKYPIDTKLFVQSLQNQIILRKCLLSPNALNSFKNLKEKVQNIINNNNEENLKNLNDMLDNIDIIVFEKMLELLEKLRINSLIKDIFELSTFLNMLSEIELYINDSNTEENIQYFKFMKFLLTKLENKSFNYGKLSKQIIELFQNYIFD